MSRREPNNPAAPDQRYTLPESRILRGKRDFETLFSGSGTAYLALPAVSLRYVVLPNPEKGIKFGFIAPKKTGGAVQRNRCKRLLREAFRLNQHILIETADTLQIGIHAVLIARHKNLDFKTAGQQVAALLRELSSRLHQQTHLS